MLTAEIIRSLVEYENPLIFQSFVFYFKFKGNYFMTMDLLLNDIHLVIIAVVLGFSDVLKS